MKISARLLALLLAMMLFIVPGALAEGETAPEATELLSPTPTPTAEPNPADVLITVNGVEITRAVVDEIANNLVASYSQYGYSASDPTFMALIYQMALDYAVQLEILDQKAVELGCDQFTPEELAQFEADNAAEWNALVDSYVMYYGGVTADSTEEEIAAARVNMLAMLESMGYTEAVMLQSTLDNAKLDRVEAIMVEGVEVTDADVRAVFDEYVLQDEANYAGDVGMYEYMTQYYGETSYYVPAGYRGVTHILLEVDEELLGNYQALAAELEEGEELPEGETTAEGETAAEEGETAVPVTQADVDAAHQAILDSVQPTIDEINRKLAEGVPFADLIVEYGADPGMESEPYKSEGYMVHMDSIVYDPVFVQAAFSVNNVGDISQPVVSSFGVHIVQYTRDVPAGPVEYTEAIALELHEAVLSEKENEQYSIVMQQWLDASTIVYSAEAQAMLDAAAAIE